MSHKDARIELDTSVGYLLKEAASALRAAMEAVLRPLGMSITHYACLELLAQRPGLSNSDLARGAFVSRQSMNVLLQSLERDGYVTRPEHAPEGRVLPTRLTELGRSRLDVASAAVRGVEDRMRSDLDAAEREQLRLLLGKCVAALS
ncbi:MarR family transcriptional regulator [Cryobacterium lactosi]|uniref:MarR family transcriptional regulator n=1 Tax=Cryobacterium lactosi TaxID=1259202 RepID=A0A4R9BYX1_9MICO|nr:MarR family transcriptional regulator [Cryobacterium lactosi]TFD94596.1 MarR family transcriptional regulator [Cryobacterium lactosi]